MSANLQIAAHERDHVRIFSLSGDLSQTDGSLMELIQPTDRALILNFTEVNYINSAGIAQLICLLRHTQENHLNVLIHGLSSHYQKIFEMVGLTQYFYIYPDEKSALAAAGII